MPIPTCTSCGNSFDAGSDELANEPERWCGGTDCKKFPKGCIRCLNHGFVALRDAMGDDKSIVEAARLSVAGENVRAVSDDRALMRYLMRHRHTTPFEMVEFKFRIKLPIFAARQLVRHRTANLNEMSARYSELPEEFYVPAPEHVQYQSSDNKQGRAGQMEHARDRAGEFHMEANRAFNEYHDRLELGMARELARINLPLSTYTVWEWKMDLHNLFHFLALRLDEHSQYETRVYARAIASFVAARCPMAWEAFEDFRLNAISLSRQDVVGLEMVLVALKTQLGVDDFEKHLDAVAAAASFPTKREREEFRVKLARIV